MKSITSFILILAMSLALTQTTFAEQPQSNKNDHKKAQVSGEVMDVRTVNFNNKEGKYLLAKVKTKEGKTAIFNMGKLDNLQSQNVKIKKGQKIEAQGPSGRINNKPVIVVYRYNLIE